MTRTILVSGLAGAGLLAAAMACGGSDGPTSPSPGGDGGGGGASSTATITISSSGAANPRAVTILRGGQVTFVNNDSRPHVVSSDPHPVHTDCPEINQANNLGAGQTLATAAMNTVRTCGFHDHDDPGNAALQGTITIVQ